MQNQINVLVVDDSAFMRKSLTLLLESDPSIKVIDTAIDGLMAIEKIKKLKPDLVTLDIEMPRMDGLTALGKIMKECPTPVLMVSSLTLEGADVTLKALELGAVDFIPKEMSFVSVSITSIKEELVSKVKAIYKNKSVMSKVSKLNFTGLNKASVSSKSEKYLPKMNYRALALGISTGGPISLQKVVPLFSNKINIPIFIVQHMPPKFTASLADRLNSLSELEVKEASNNEIVRNGVVYIAPGGFHMTLKKDNLSNIQIAISEQPDNVLHRPSVDVMLDSVLSVYGKYTLGVIMTGMGKDGLEGIKKLKASGGYCIAQDEDSSVVYGMPRAIVNNGLADIVASLEDIPKIINQAI
ncbi:MAG: chemotaxis response regulator protein-glutamate methylesterase [Melioribacteraceae bacterium]|nr:chemotaxis response regulator protein-glutamate methylesterase [Melioribacteraceae bacterium]